MLLKQSIALFSVVSVVRLYLQTRSWHGNAMFQLQNCSMSIKCLITNIVVVIRHITIPKWWGCWQWRCGWGQN